MHSSTRLGQKNSVLDLRKQYRRKAKRLFLGIAMVSMLILVLIACVTEPTTNATPRLIVSNTTLSLTAASPQESFLIRNEGEAGSILTWEIRTESLALVVNPSSGTVSEGEEQFVSITADQKAITPDTPILEELDIVSDGGQKTVRVSFRIGGSGLAACGTFPAINLQSQTNSIATPRALTPYVANELLIKYKEPQFLRVDGTELSLESRQLLLRSSERSLANRYAFSIKKEATVVRPSLITVPEGQDPLVFAKLLEQDPQIDYAEPNYYLETLATPNDPLFNQQWHLSNFGLEEAWEIETGSKDVVIAVIDSGVDMNHEDLAGKMLPGCDFFSEDNNPNPGLPNGGRSEHGTHVAGIAAAIGNNETGVAGVAYGSGVQILPLKVFDDAGVNGKVDNLIDAILWAAGIPIEGVGVNPKPAEIINMSLGVRPEVITDRLESIADAVEQAKNKGVILFAASGNAGASNQILSPASDVNVIAVGSVDDDFSRSSFSNYDNSGGPTVDLMAPGGKSDAICSGSGVYSTYPEDTEYACLQGTSMASPFAAGVAALILSQNPNLSPDQLKEKMIATAFYDDATMNPQAFGKGVVCADKALGASTTCGK